MAPRKTERMMNLFIALLVSRQYLPKDRIRRTVEGYSGLSDQAFDRMFERDKDDLRDLGITVEMGSNDKLFDDEVGYRIKRDDVELADIDLTREEAAVVGLASQVWEHAGLARDSSSAVAKLKAAGITVDTSVLRMVEPRIAATEPAFDRMLEAVSTRRPVRFDYRRPGAEILTRSVQPWEVISLHGRWYMAGFDLDRGEPRVFRLTRVLSEVHWDGTADSYAIPPADQVKESTNALYPPPTIGVAVVRMRKGSGQALRRMASSVVDVDTDFDELTIDFHSTWEIAADIASYGPSAVAISPPQVRELVIRRLKSAAGVSA